MGDEGPPEPVRTLFWGLVIVFNVAVFGLAVGTMVLVFEGDVVLGGALVGVGAVAAAVGLYGYRRGRGRVEAA